MRHLFQVFSFLVAGTKILRVLGYSFIYTDYIKRHFEETFHEKCDKYPFVNTFTNLLDQPSEKYVMFVFQDPGLKNGGLGDRLGGLISAVEFSVRFNRTLVIRSHNDMPRLFRPYHPTDISSDNPKYLWSNWLSWTKFRMEWTDHDETEYDMWQCMNNNGHWSDYCSLEGGEPSQPTILYRSNRCYLCRQDFNHGNGFGHRDLVEKLGVNSTNDLFEVAGCMLRLAFWPTDELWKEVDKFYHEFGKIFGLTTDPPKFQRHLRQAQQSLRSQHFSEKNRNSSSRHLQVVMNQENRETNSKMISNSVSPGHSVAPSKRKKGSAFYQISLHFRCGDRSYFANGAPNECEFHDTNTVGSSYMQSGNPVVLAKCAREVYMNHTQSLIKEHRGLIQGKRVFFLFIYFYLFIYLFFFCDF
jgi:hypothetical protein